MNEPIECHVCLEPMEELLLVCRHAIHPSCIAKSGKHNCSVCQVPVVFNAEDEQVFQSAKTLNDQTRVRQEQSDSLALAQLLSRGGGSDDDVDVEDVRGVVLHINNRVYRITFSDILGAIDAGDLTLQVNQIMHNIQNRVQTFTTDERALELFKLISIVNQIAATTGLSVPQICGIVENNC
jgi:hypothetical protein